MFSSRDLLNEIVIANNVSIDLVTVFYMKSTECTDMFLFSPAVKFGTKMGSNTHQSLFYLGAP